LKEASVIREEEEESLLFLVLSSSKFFSSSFKFGFIEQALSILSQAQVSSGQVHLLQVHSEQVHGQQEEQEEDLGFQKTLLTKTKKAFSKFLKEFAIPSIQLSLIPLRGQQDQTFF